MADFGSNFIDAFSAVYGAKLKSKQLAMEETRANAQEKRAQADFDYTQGERKKKAAIQGLMAGASNTVNPGVSANEGMNGMTALQGEKTPNLAPATMADMQSIAARPTAALPTPAPAQAPVSPPAAGLPTPTAAPAPMPTAAAAIPTPAAPTAPVGIQAKPPAAIAPMQISHPDAEGNVNTISPDTPVISNADKAKLPNPDDYAETMLNGKHVWVPKDKVTKLSGGDLAMAQGQAVLESGLDPALGMDMIKNAQLISKNNIDATVEKYGRAVINAQASGDKLAALDAYNVLSPSLGKAEIVPAKGGFIVKHYRANPDGSKTYVGDDMPYISDELHSADAKFFADLRSLASPTAMQTMYADQADQAMKISTLAHQRHTEEMDKKTFNLTANHYRAEEANSFNANNLAQRRLDLEEGKANSEWSVKQQFDPSTGEAFVTRSNKAGQIQFQDPAWNGMFVDANYRNKPDLVKTMTATAKARGLSLTTNPATGVPMYVNSEGHASVNPNDISKTSPAAPAAKPVAKPAATMPTPSADAQKLQAIISNPKSDGRAVMQAQAKLNALRNKQGSSASRAASGKALVSGLPRNYASSGGD
jgi:hypothetical protein